jgi:hypothetical protein
VARGVDGRALLRNRLEHARALQRRAFAGDGQPVVLIVEALERGLAEALCASMAQEHEAVLGFEGRWIVGELEGLDGPRLDACTPQQILADERAVVAGAGPDQKDA